MANGFLWWELKVDAVDDAEAAAAAAAAEEAAAAAAAAAAKVSKGPPCPAAPRTAAVPPDSIMSQGARVIIRRLFIEAVLSALFCSRFSKLGDHKELMSG